MEAVNINRSHAMPDTPSIILDVRSLDVFGEVLALLREAEKQLPEGAEARDKITQFLAREAASPHPYPE